MTADGDKVTFYDCSPDLDINQTLRSYLQKLSFSWGSQLSLSMLCPFLLPSHLVPRGKDDEFYTLRCSSVECQPQKFSLKVPLPPSVFSPLPLGDIWCIGWGLQAAPWQLQTCPRQLAAAIKGDDWVVLSSLNVGFFKPPLGSENFQRHFFSAAHTHS